MIPKETIDEIFQTARVEEVIADFMSIKKAGSNYKAKSPFVDEKTPSFMISPAKQIWKCFSSGKGGNVVTFLMEAEHMTYPEALKWLASKYNIEIKEDKERTPEEIQSASVRENLSVISEFAKKHFKHNLFENEEGKAIGLSYFIERGFREDIIKKFDLGYCLDQSNVFTESALAKGYRLEYLIKSGLTKTKDNRHFDFFRGRVMFPIHSIAGKVLGFGGRTLKSDKKIAKYFNSPESELYNKSKILYGLYFAKNAIIKYDMCYLVEGYTDVISLHQSGVENVVSSSGTSLTEGQINLIKRYSSNITILYDGDAAGIKASFRGIDMILAHGMNVKVVLFPDGEDPDSYAKVHSDSEVKSYIIENAKDFIVFKSDVLLNESGEDPIKKAELIRDIITSIALIPDSIKQQVYLRECASLFDMSEQLLTSELAKIKRQKLLKEEKQNRFRNNQALKSRNKLREDTQANEPPPEALIPPEYLTEEQGQKIKDDKTKPKTKLYVKDRLYQQEFDIIRLLLIYGRTQIRIKTIGEEEKQEVNVIEFIISEIEKDNLSFKDDRFQKIFNEFKKGVIEDTLYKEDHFSRMDDKQIMELSVNILADKEKKQLSPEWLKKKVRIKTEEENLERAVNEAIYSFKTAWVIDEISKIQEELTALYKKEENDMDEIYTLMAKQNKLEKVKIAFSEKLGRIII
ncbi:MAG TPA: DNA primase [Crocinitomix sp.]|nr:DNA primase [Crocinitomix sp.]